MSTESQDVNNQPQQSSGQDQPVSSFPSSGSLVGLSARTQAYLQSHVDDPPSDSESDRDDENTATIDPHTLWKRLSSALTIVAETPRNETRASMSRMRPPRKRSGSSKPILSHTPTEEELTAPYIPEEIPDQPEFMRSPSQPTLTESEEVQPQEHEADTTARTSARDSLKAAVRRVVNFGRATGESMGRTHLQTAETIGVLMPTFPSALAVPFLWLRKDNKGRNPPPVLLDALKLAITDSVPDEHFYNISNVFRIELEYGDVKWVVSRTGSDFLSLYVALKSRLELPGIPAFPAGIYSWLKSSLFPGSSAQRASRANQAALERRRELQDYLLQLTTILSLHVVYELYEFFELSAISITRDMGWKGKEGYLENKVEKFYRPICTFRSSNEKWEKEWVIVRDSYIGFCSDISSRTPADVFLLDSDFKCEMYEKTGLSGMFQMHDRVNVENSSRRIELKGDSRMLKEFMLSVSRLKQSSPWVKQHRHRSYAPIRKAAKVKWYIDGKDYFFAVSEAIAAAKHEIYIEDWWLSPELYLRRPPKDNEDFRLDRLLKRKAEEGVMIYIVVYKEVSYALTLDSHHTKFYLQSLHKNIKVQRHPDHGPDGIMFWAHHEKMVVVDSRLAFIGGLDLCFGRYDTHTHQLVDYHPTGKRPTIWPGQDYSNPRIKDFVNVKDFTASLVDKTNVPRMPWHDVSVGMVGPPARDVARHFVQRWNFIKDSKAYGRESLPFLVPKGEYVSTRDESKFKGSCRVQLLRSSSAWSSGIKLENSIYNAYCHLIRNAKHFIYIENQFFITSSERDPNSVVKNRIGALLFERIKEAHKKNEKFRVIVVMPLLPAFEADLNSNDAGTIRMVMHWQYVSICRGGKSLLEKIAAEGINPEDYISFFALRSYDRVNQINKDTDSKKTENGDAESTLGSTESTIHVPDSIAQYAMEYVDDDSHERKDSFSDEKYDPHIEKGLGGTEPVRPTAMLSTDLKQAYVTEELYVHTKVLIVDDKYVICGSANLNDRSQLGSRDSEVAILIEDTKTVKSRMNGEEYDAAKFAYTLRVTLFKEHLGLLPPQHHNTMERSSLPPMSREEIEAFAHRKDESVSHMFDYSPDAPDSKHPTKEDLIVMDPLSDKFYNYWLETALTNTETYRAVFRCIPDDNVRTLEQCRQFVPDPKTVPVGHVANTQASAEDVNEKLRKIRGHLVVFPMHFLEEENLLGSVIASAVTPAEIFT